MSDIWPMIRLATEMDLQPAFKLMSELGYPGLSLPHFVKTYHALLEHPSMFLIVAEDENAEVIALASLTSRPQLRLTGRLVTIDELVVADRARGQGLGRKILKAAEAMARRLGARKLELATDRDPVSYLGRCYIAHCLRAAHSA